jgi:hypothetical protein
MTVRKVPDHRTASTITNKVISMSYGCKTADGQHIYGDNGRCLICWKMKNDTNQSSRVLVVVISAETSECERVNELAEIVEAQVRAVFKTVALIEGEKRHLNRPTKPLEMEVHAS